MPWGTGMEEQSLWGFPLSLRPSVLLLSLEIPSLPPHPLWAHSGGSYQPQCSLLECPGSVALAAERRGPVHTCSVSTPCCMPARGEPCWMCWGCVGPDAARSCLSGPPAL